MAELTQENLIPRRSCGIVTLEALKAYAEASGDHNPIHQDEAAAKSMGLPGIIAHGMWVSGRMHSRAEEAIREIPSLREMTAVPMDLERSQTRFRAMTLLGDEVFVEGSWQMLDSDRVSLDLAAKNSKDEVLVQGQMIFKRGAIA